MSTKKKKEEKVDALQEFAKTLPDRIFRIENKLVSIDTDTSRLLRGVENSHNVLEEQLRDIALNVGTTRHSTSLDLNFIMALVLADLLLTGAVLALTIAHLAHVI